MATFSGTSGNDSLLGTSGDDQFLMGGTGGTDTINGAGGFDSIEFSSRATSAIVADFAAGTISGGSPGTISFTNIERIVAGNFNDRIFGSAAGQTLNGLGGADTLWGAGGIDVLWGGAGADNFLFREVGSGNADSVRDFGSGTDKLVLDGAAMSALGSSGNFAAGDARFKANSTGTATDASDRVIYNTATRQVFYDADGNGSGGAQLIATLQSGATLAATDIVVEGGGSGGGQVINGTAGDDSLVGGPGNDTINGFAGDDTLVGLGGDDSLVGGAGADSMLGGEGNDTLHEEGFGDTLDGGMGDDTYFVGASSEIRDAGGLDTVITGSTFYTLGAGLENLVLRPFRQATDVEGWGNELDNLITNEGDFATGHLSGADGDDTLIGSNTAQDNFFFLAGSGDIGNDVVDGGSGDGDQLWVGYFSAVVVDFRTGSVTGGGTGGSGSVSFVNIEEVFGREFDDLLIADDAGRLLDGGDGNDTLTGGAGNDTFRFFESSILAAGTDSADGRGGVDLAHYAGSTFAVTVDLGAGTMVTDGGSSATLVSIENFFSEGRNDRITGSSVANELYSSGGSDTIDGGAGNDTLGGGTGSTSYVFSVSPGAANADLVQGFSSGEDRIVLNSAAHVGIGAEGAFSAADARFWSSATGTAHDADDRVIYNTSTGELWYDADGSGAGTAQRIATLQTGFGDPAAPNLAATDVFVTGPGGETGEHVVGTSGNDSLVGGAGTDTLEGFAGNDTLDGGAGGDTMDGGLQDDVYIVDNSADVVVEFEGGGSNDLLLSSVHIHTLPDWVNHLTLTGSADLLGSGNELDNRITGNAGGNFIAGGNGNDTLDGGAGDDNFVTGGFGDDSVSGGDGEDALDGGGGTDTLDGGAGNDTLYGASGSTDSLPDTYLFSVAPGIDNFDFVDRFVPGRDKLVLDARVHANAGASGNFSPDDPRFWAAPFNAAHDADDRVIYDTRTGQLFYDADGNGAGAAQLIAFLNGAPTVAATDIAIINASGGGGQVINGTAGNDTLTGTAGNDTINGLGGNDLFRAGSSGGADVINGGAGFDSIEFASRATSAVVVDFGAGTIMGGSSGSISFTGIERVVASDFNDSLTGNGAAQSLTGRAGADTLWGAGGIDTLWGGGGADMFIFRETGSANADSVRDWASGSDKVALDNSPMSALGAMGNFAAGDGRFWAAAGATAGHDANDRVVYNTSTGSLYYDADGSGAGAAQLIATFQGNPAVSATDIVVI